MDWLHTGLLQFVQVQPPSVHKLTQTADSLWIMIHLAATIPGQPLCSGSIKMQQGALDAWILGAVLGCWVLMGGSASRTLGYQNIFFHNSPV